MARWVFAVLAALWLSALVTAAQASEVYEVRVTYYYPTGNPMYSGHYPFEGAAACSWNFPLGTQLAFADGRVVTCLDRGHLGWSGWVDVFVWGPAAGRLVAESYSPYADVTVLRWGWGE